jgi:hypothetical protein
MKVTLSVIALAIVGIFFIQGTPVINIGEQGKTFYPAGVKNVIDNKCYGCHSVTGKSQDARDALMWDSLPGVERRVMIATLDEIIEVLDEGTMPPEDVVKKYPEARLLPEEKKILKAWAEAKADSLLK